MVDGGRLVVGQRYVRCDIRPMNVSRRARDACPGRRRRDRHRLGRLRGFDRLLPPGLGQTGSRAPPKRRQRAAAVLIGATRPAADTPCPASGGRSARDPGAARPSEAQRRTAKPSKGRRPRAARRVFPRHRTGDVEQRQIGRQRGGHGLVLAAVVDPCGPGPPAPAAASPAGRGSGRPGRSSSP
jgi:hypothetical protein